MSPAVAHAGTLDLLQCQGCKKETPSLIQMGSREGLCYVCSGRCAWLVIYERRANRKGSQRRAASYSTKRTLTTKELPR